MNDINKLEKVISGLEWCMNEKHDCYREKECPYENEGEDIGCKYALHRDALELLKAQEPKVLTKDDFAGNPKCDKNGNLPVWIEYRTGLCGWVVTSAETMYICMYAHGRQKFRYWTSKPTREQMEAVKWDG